MPSRNAAAAYFAPNDDSQNWETLSIAELERALASMCSRSLTDKCGNML